MTILSIILAIIGLTKLYIAATQEKYEIEEDLVFEIKSDLNRFHKKLILLLVVDGLIGVICGLLMYCLL